MKSDIEIAQEAMMQPIKEVAASYGISEDDLELYGKYKAKLTDKLWDKVKDRPDGKLVLVTAINPTPAGEGKTTTTVGLGEAFGRMKKSAIIALREPSLGPCFGIKGGAAGGGYAQVVPMEDLNLHFTGDFHAITSANNLLAALLDNHIQQGNALGIDPRQVMWKRCEDMNDRALRNIVIGLGAKADGMVREDHFVITVASEIMAILCLADNMEDLKARLGRIIVAYDFAGQPVTADDLHATGSMAALLKDALKPNLIQTLEHTGALVHGGPFANIAHGCNSVRATKTALKLADIVVTEAGFGADLGAEKFLGPSVGLGEAFGRMKKSAIIALREPSLGPCFGIKGGAAGGGYAQVVPMEDLNLHFTGDFHAITSANNLLAALLDNHIQQGNALGIDPRQVMWKRCEDMNDRALRNIVIGLGAKADGMVREDHFVITVASEIMAILCLADNMEDLKARLGRIIVAYDFAGQPVTADDLHATGSMAALLKDALKPNLIQTLEHTGALVHGGPFANIAHGCNSVRATKTALKLADIVVTEAGFGADLGAEKFLDIKCRMAGLKPDAVVLVATVRALKYNGGVPKDQLSVENLDALKRGIVNLEKHIENIQKYDVPVIVTLNSFITDTEAEYAYIKKFCEDRSCEFALSEVWAKGGEGGIALAQKVLETLEHRPGNFRVLYPDDISLKDKIRTVATEIYGADGVTYAPAASKALKNIEDMGFGNLPVCMAKTQYSLSDDQTKLGRPTGFTINVRDAYVSAGAGFVVALTGSIMTMPGLPKKPAAENIDVDKNGRITGLF